MKTIKNSNAVSEVELSEGEYIKVGKNTYFVKVHFGKFPLETILRARVLSEREHTEKAR